MKHNSLESIPALLCGHAEGGYRDGYRWRCRICSSFWDLDSNVIQNYHYDDSYPQARRHLNVDIGELKISSLRRWLKHLNRDHAIRLGVPSERIFDGNNLPERLSESIDLWIFQDSFEHLPKHADFVNWMLRSSAPAAGVLVVAPQAGSFSERMLGRVWPHKLPDHLFHWSKQGLVSFFETRGFKLSAEFNPLKTISLQVVLAHIAHKTGLYNLQGPIERWLPTISFPFNFGEQGMLFKLGALPPQ